MDEALSKLTEFIAAGTVSPEGSATTLLKGLFGSRYHQRYGDQTLIRDALKLPVKDAPFAGLIAPENPPSGAYGGASLVWFPIPGKKSLITYVVGTNGLSPDEGLLSRPGHRRRVAALRRYLTRLGVMAWSKAELTAIATEFPHHVANKLRWTPMSRHDFRGH